jgi:hypothetical protein
MSDVSKSVAISPSAAAAAGCTAQCPGVQTNYSDGWSREYTLSASAASGWRFVKFTWSKVRRTASGTTPIGDYESSSNPSTAADGLAEARVYGDKTYWQEDLIENIVAHFEPDAPTTTYTASASASPSGWGTVKVGSAAAGSTSTLANITAGSTVTVVATPATGYHFVSWSDGGAQTHDVTVNSDINLTATFEYVGTVTITIQANDFGLVRFKGQAVDPQRGPIQMEVPKNSSVTIEAFPRYNSKFKYWHILNGSDYYHTREITIGATGNWTVHAEFVQVIEAHARLLNNPDATCQFGEVRIVPRNEPATAWGQDVRVEIHSSQEVYVQQRSTVAGWALDHFWSKDTSTGSESSVYLETWSNAYQGSSYGYIVNALFHRTSTNLLVNSFNRSSPVQLVYDPETNKLVADY